MTAIALGLAALAGSSVAQAQLALPVNVPTSTLSSTGTVLVYTIDLDTLPARPKLVVDVYPDTDHGDIALEVEVGNFVPFPSISPNSFCPLNPAGAAATSYVSDPSSGPLHFEVDLYDCHPGPTIWNGIDVDVAIRTLDFGSAGAPASITINIEGVTQVPTGTLTQQVMGLRTVVAEPSQDTVLYSVNPTGSNGAGQFLWSGTRVVPNPFNPLFFIRDPWHSLLKFRLDLVVPSNAVVMDVDLDLFATGTAGAGGTVDVFAVAPLPPGNFWFAGFADSPGDESGGAAGSSSSATWTKRTFSENWSTPGGDTTTTTPLASTSIAASGPHNFSSSGLVAALQQMVDSDNHNDGFLLMSPSGSTTTVGVQFASGDHPDDALHPRISVEFDQSEPYGEGSVAPGTVDFLDEGEDFRWVYDLDDDGIFTTDIGGVCESLSTFPTFTYPYAYSYAGDPGFVGIDCCTWRITSTQSATVGTGQALFFHNIDASDPANLPPDSDGDGIRDGCDNCQHSANGPFLGSCVGSVGVGGPCHSDLECGPGETCHLSQQDADGDFAGDACAAPEPGFGVGIMLGAGVLTTLRRRSRDRN